nr:hypothetical protein Iba_chr12dCG21810 [Ipomoea batatas]
MISNYAHTSKNRVVWKISRRELTTFVTTTIILIPITCFQVANNAIPPACMIFHTLQINGSQYDLQGANHTSNPRCEDRVQGYQREELLVYPMSRQSRLQLPSYHEVDICQGKCRSGDHS